MPVVVDLEPYKQEILDRYTARVTTDDIVDWHNVNINMSLSLQWSGVQELGRQQRTSGVQRTDPYDPR